MASAACNSVPSQKASATRGLSTACAVLVSESMASDQKPVNFLAVEMLERSMNTVGGRGPTAKAVVFWGRAAAFLWLFLLLSAKFCYQAWMDVQHAKEEELCDLAGFEPDSPECAEAQLFRSWQANVAAEELLDLRGLLRETLPATGGPAVGASVGEDTFQRQLPTQHTQQQKQLELQELEEQGSQRQPHLQQPNPQHQPLPTPDAAGQAESTQQPPSAQPAAEGAGEAPEAQPGKAESRPSGGGFLAPSSPEEAYEAEDAHGDDWHLRVLLEIAEATCELCQSLERRDLEECAEFKGVASCAEARRQGLLDGWMDELQELQANASQELQDQAVAEDGAEFSNWIGGIEISEHFDQLRQQHEDMDRQASGEAAELMSRLCADPSRRDYPACKDYLPASVKSAQSLAKIGQHFSGREVQRRGWDMRASEEMRTLKVDLCATAAAKDSAACRQAQQEAQVQEALGEQLRALEEEHSDWDRRIEERTAALKRELCADPARAHYAACAHAGEEEMDARMHDLGVQHQKWDHEASEQMASLERELCADPARRGYPACLALAGSSAARAGDARVHVGAASSLRGSGVLTWPQGGFGSHLRWSMGPGSSASVVAEADIADPAIHWEGSIPKIVCVTVVPDGPEALRRLKTSVDSFRAQTYEGEKELHLVYHARSKETAALVQSFTDDALITAVAAYGDEEYPCTAPFRFGAWKSDADLVARWDVGAWHHPRRLSSQVRALARAQRPASLLAAESLTGSPAAQEETLVGEAVWMRIHWFPLLKDASPLLEGGYAGQLTLLRAAEHYYQAV